MNAEELQAEIARAFSGAKCPALTHSFLLRDLHEFGAKHATRIVCDQRSMQDRLSDVWWAIASAQLSLGYVFLAKPWVSRLRGAEQTVYNVQHLQYDGVGDIHFWHHANLSYESIYRVWERLANLLRLVIAADPKEKFYYDGIVDVIGSDARYNRLSAYKTLRKQLSHWNTIARERNKLSHARRF